MPHPPNTPTRDIVVAAASAGGVEALLTFAGNLPADLQAAICILLHVLETGTSLLPNILNRRSALSAAAAVDGQPVEPGRIYVAVPGRHLVLDSGQVRLIAGPRENGHRPSADVLFRSAALAYGARVIGVVLSGADDDGAAGLSHIKRAGGLAVVQDPKEALHSRMPESALGAVKVDYCLPVREIARLVAELAPARSSLPEGARVNENAEREPDVHMQNVEAPQPGATPAVYTCPECHGTLWELDEGGVLRFRCRVGHAYTAEHLLSGQSQEIESAVWMAVRTLEEKAQLSDKLCKRAQSHGLKYAAQRFERDSIESLQAAERLREVLLDGEKSLLAHDGPVAEGESLPADG
ncbi:MAG TPA: chemotaxis protein CheB [Chloroflexota bacterium]|nr:chemotaxis protein CheB [Chloroflexota bacterium]